MTSSGRGNRNNEQQEKDKGEAAAAAAAASTEQKQSQQLQLQQPSSMKELIRQRGRVPYGEESRKFRRTVYTHEDWVKHRSESRITRNLQGMVYSGVLRQLKNEIALVVAVASFVILWNSGIAPYIGLPDLTLPVLPFTLSSPALGLLLVFRTNTSYSRWLDSRKNWGLIINHCNNIVRMASSYIDTSDPRGRLALERLWRATWTIPRCLTNRLAGKDEDDVAFETEIRDAYAGDDPTNFIQHVLLEAPNRPAAAMLELTMILNDSPIETLQRIEIDKSIVIIGDCIGSCERIFTSPVPLVYTRHTARALSCWLLLLPLALYGSFVEDGANLISVAEYAAYMFALVVISIFFFGIEELAVTLEEPFSILPMHNFCDKIRKTTEAVKDRAISLSTSHSGSSMT